jgi:hypothetical protein
MICTIKLLIYHLIPCRGSSLCNFMKCRSVLYVRWVVSYNWIPKNYILQYFHFKMFVVESRSSLTELGVWQNFESHLQQSQKFCCKMFNLPFNLFDSWIFYRWNFEALFLILWLYCFNPRPDWDRPCFVLTFLPGRYPDREIRTALSQKLLMDPGRFGRV